MIAIPPFARLLALTVLHFSAMAGLLLAGRWIREMGGSESVLGWFSASIVPGIVLGALLAGRLANRHGERPLLLVGLLLTAVTTGSLALFEQISWWFVPLRFGLGLGHGMAFTCLISLAAHTVPDHQKARGIGYVALCAQLGNFAGVALAENLLQPQGFAWVFIGCALLSITAGGVSATLANRAERSAGNTAEAPGLIPTRAQIVISVAFFIVLGGTYGSVLQLIPLLVQDLPSKNGVAAHATPVLAAVFFTVMVCRLLLARLADSRFRRSVLTGSATLLVAATAGWPYADSMAAMIAVAVFFALGYGMLFPGLNGLVLASVSGAWRSRASGWIVMAFDGGFFGLLLVFGPVAERWSYAVMFALLCLLQIVTAFAFMVMARRMRA